MFRCPCIGAVLGASRFTKYKSRWGLSKITKYKSRLGLLIFAKYKSKLGLSKFTKYKSRLGLPKIQRTNPSSGFQISQNTYPGRQYNHPNCVSVYSTYHLLERSVYQHVVPRHSVDGHGHLSPSFRRRIAASRILPHESQSC